MEESPSKRSVAELAGRLQATPPASDEVPFLRRPPCSLKLQRPAPDNDEAHKRVVSPNPLKLRMKSSPIIEKLQANLALSPTALLPSPKSPDVKLPPAPPPPPSPRGPPGPVLPPSQPSTEEEEPVGFDSPPDGAALRSINKTRARLSFKRRPPTRQHRRSAGEEAFGSGSAPCEENGNRPRGADNPAEEDEFRDPGLREETDGDGNCEKTEGEGGGGEREPGEEQTLERGQEEEEEEEEQTSERGRGQEEEEEEEEQTSERGRGQEEEEEEEEEQTSERGREEEEEEEQTSERGRGQEEEEEEEQRRRPEPWPAEQTQGEVMGEEVQEEMSHSSQHGGGDGV
ncbi:capZ-interacting protein isoform X2 [Betta splendens]|uniref:CapZ-interacting protein isoform X2 n=1 Tax=Betta splendens TaxID=158456 RepID=A0A6P7P599_BETSP|nr:capZ-interacting protein isoform X2 [Betta splendens]